MGPPQESETYWSQARLRRVFRLKSFLLVNSSSWKGINPVSPPFYWLRQSFSSLNSLREPNFGNRVPMSF
jgi:hypothetical protein